MGSLRVWTAVERRVSQPDSIHSGRNESLNVNLSGESHSSWEIVCVLNITRRSRVQAWTHRILSGDWNTSQDDVPPVLSHNTWLRLHTCEILRNLLLDQHRPVRLRGVSRDRGKGARGKRQRLFLRWRQGSKVVAEPPYSVIVRRLSKVELVLWRRFDERKSTAFDSLKQIGVSPFCSGQKKVS